MKQLDEGACQGFISKNISKGKRERGFDGKKEEGPGNRKSLLGTADQPGFGRAGREVFIVLFSLLSMFWICLSSIRRITEEHSRHFCCFDFYKMIPY